MEDCFHQRAVKRSSRIERRDNCARRGHERAKPCIAGLRRVELNAAVNLRVNTNDGLTFAPRENGRFEFTGGRLDSCS
jgi:hypothetical protein